MHNINIINRCSAEICCRMWDVDRDENYVLGLKMNDVVDNTEMITCIAFCQAKGWQLFAKKTCTVVGLVQCLLQYLHSEVCCHRCNQD